MILPSGSHPSHRICAMGRGTESVGRFDRAASSPALPILLQRASDENLREQVQIY